MTELPPTSTGSLRPITQPAFLCAQAVSYKYRHAASPAVQGVSLSLGCGEVVAIVGPNGCGKSTLLRLLCGQLRPASGRIALQGHDVTALSVGQIARQIALVPQQTSAGFPYSVREMVVMARWSQHGAARAGSGGRGAGMATALGFETTEDHAIADRAMWEADVHHMADRSIHDLSGGERQRVIVARALAQQTPAILLDEPTSSLDLYHQLDLLGHLQSLSRQAVGPKCIVIVTHDLNLALQFADRALLMDGGHLVADGRPQEVLTPANLQPVYRVAVAVGAANVLVFSRQK